MIKKIATATIWLVIRDNNMYVETRTDIGSETTMIFY